MMDNCKTKCCRPPKLLKSNAYQPVSNTLAGQTLIYMQMSNHYRRVENAKSIVDSGLHSNNTRTRHCNYYDSNSNKNCNGPNPCEYNSARHSNLYSASSTRTNLNDNSMYSPSPSDMDLVDQIVYDDKHKPNAFYKDANGLVYAPTSHIQCATVRDTKKKKSATKTRAKSRSRSPAKSVKKNIHKPNVPMDIIDHHPKQFVPSKNFQPRILKSTAQSRIQDLSVYHAPRKRPQPTQQRDPQGRIWLTDSQIQLLDQVNKGEPHTAHFDDPWNFEESEIKHREADKRPSSKGSSRSYGCDSAYCGEVSSGGGSRGSTPERSMSAKKTPPPKRDLTFNEETYSIADSQDFPMSVEPTRNEDTEFLGGSFTGKGNLEAAYATFLRKITEDILERGIFTDKGINSIFQRHIEENKYELDQERMQLEVSNLRKQLGIVEDVPTQNLAGMRGTTPNRGTNPNPSLSETHCRADCLSEYKAQPLKKNHHVNVKEPGIEDIIRDMEHCVKVDAHIVESACCCPSEKRSDKIGCGCDNTCNNSFNQFFDLDRTGVGNRTYTTEQVSNISYGVPEPYVKPYESKFYAEPVSVKTYDDTIRTDQRAPKKLKNEKVYDYDVNEDTTTKSSKGSRGQSTSTSNETPSKSKESSSYEDEMYISDTDMDGYDSCGTAHVESLCSNIKVESNDDFMIEKFFLDDLKDSESMFDQEMNETEIININNFSDTQIENPRDEKKKVPEESFGESSVMDSSVDSAMESETESRSMRRVDTGDGRTVFFNKALEDESSMEPLTDSKGNTLDRVMKETAPSSKEDLFDATSSKVLVTFATDKNAQGNTTNPPGNSDGRGRNGDNRTNQEKLRRDQQPSGENKGCFGPCSKKKATPATPPPLKSALKARE